VLLSLLLVGPFGILGIAIARGITFPIDYAIEFWSLRIHLSLRLDVASLSKILLCGLTMASVVYGVERAFHATQLLGIYVAIGAASYLGLVRQMRLARRRDFEVMKELLGTKFSSVVDVAEKLVLAR